MIVQIIVQVLLVAIAAVAAYYVMRAANDIRQSRAQWSAAYKQAKAVSQQVARTEAQFKRVTQNVYEYQTKVDKVLLDPKVQAALNRHEES